MPWWLWILAGFLLFGIEALTPSLHIAFFGFGAVVVGALVALGLGGPLWVQLLLFSVISVASLALLRKPLLRAFRLDRGPDEVDTLVGENAAAIEPIAPGARGKAELRGTTWNVQNLSDQTVEPGARCTVERVEGLTLFIRPERS
ncbi:MAG TPA: NfeD family protein [Thermoanaerobaculia bacterium]|nr:NfeD family protein [Thermoanaerobaculia bacterium]